MRGEVRVMLGLSIHSGAESEAPDSGASGAEICILGILCMRR